MRFIIKLYKLNLAVFNGRSIAHLIDLNNLSSG